MTSVFPYIFSVTTLIFPSLSGIKLHLPFLSAMSVKEVLQSLVDDGMVDCERIGTSNYYWAFPSKALHARKRKLEVLDSQFFLGLQKNLWEGTESSQIYPCTPPPTKYTKQI
ncbi:hypothetical protein FD754_003236 [Muntiacus muntjak]|uniref:Mnd1 HTH domain-containing protein n=1 Tax=Muntiacus muntjak TaxID=9888 RepID=A0A5N3WBJ1_MUNMU|nr:hypothetical protein FD754_003236 [Muntiacus muntjak]